MDEETIQLFAKTTAALISAFGMISENITRMQNNQAISYTDFDFAELLVKYELDGNFLNLHGGEYESNTPKSN